MCVLQRANCLTMSDDWTWAVKRYGDKKLFASRDILGEEDEIQPNGKLFRKLGTHYFIFSSGNFIVHYPALSIFAFDQILGDQLI